MTIELTNAQKVQIAAVALVLGLSAYFLYRGNQPPPDMNVTCIVLTHKVAMDPRKPISATNPVDPTKSTVTTTFACYDGRLQFAEYAASTGLKSYVSFTPDLRRQHYEMFKDPWAKIESISDPYRKTLSYAAFSAAEKHPMGLLGRADLDADQRKAEKDARQEMLDAVALIDEGCKRGTFKSDQYTQLMATLSTYRDKSGDPTKDPAKAALALKVVQLALAYIEVMDKEKAAAIQKYIDTIDGLLKSDQKAKLGDAVRLAVRPRVAWQPPV